VQLRRVWRGVEGCVVSGGHASMLRRLGELLCLSHAPRRRRTSSS
jgi:hypothetical protein